MRILWTKLALSDLQSVRDYIADDHPDAADEVVEKIGRAVESLSSYPHLGRAGRVKETRELVVAGTPYVVPYRIKKDRLEILAVLHGSRRWPTDFS